MRRSLVFAAVLTSACLPAEANEGIELSARAKSSVAVASSLPAKQAEAPLRAARDSVPEMLRRAEQDRRGPSGACKDNSAICYDLTDGRVVYRGARQYMPRIDGLSAESISLRRDRIVLKYSFR